MAKEPTKMGCGVPNVQTLNRLLALKRFLASLRVPFRRWEGGGRAHGVLSMVV
jgi:hypothetical protein